MIKRFRKICGKLYYSNSPYFIEDNFILRFLHKNSLSTRICKTCTSFPEYKDVDIARVANMWHNAFNDICYHFGINNKGAKFLWDAMCRYNWEHLHPTEEEVNKSNEERYNSFEGDVFYCSDRWSFDRLMRCHWKFRHWIESEQKGGRSLYRPPYL